MKVTYENDDDDDDGDDDSDLREFNITWADDYNDLKMMIMMMMMIMTVIWESLILREQMAI